MTEKQRDTLTVQDLYGGYRLRRTQRAQEVSITQPSQIETPRSLHETLQRSATDRTARAARPIDAEREREGD